MPITTAMLATPSFALSRHSAYQFRETSSKQTNNIRLNGNADSSSRHGGYAFTAMKKLITIRTHVSATMTIRYAKIEAIVYCRHVESASSPSWPKELPISEKCLWPKIPLPRA